MSEAARGHLAMLLFSVLVAGSFSLGALAANEISPVAITTLRMILAAGLIGLVARRRMTRNSFRAPWRYLLLGGLFAAYFVLMFEGLKTAPPVSAAAVFTITPLVAAGFGWLLLRQVLTPRIALGLGLGGVGALWVIFRADLSALLAFRVGTGEMIYFVGCVAHAVYTPMVRRLNRGEPAVVFTFGTLVGGALLVLLYGRGDLVATDWGALPTVVWITLAYVTVFATATSFFLVQYSTLRLPSSKVMAYTYLVPSWVIIWEIGLGHGAPGGLVLVGVVLTVVALGLLLREETQVSQVSQVNQVSPARKSSTPN